MPSYRFGLCGDGQREKEREREQSATILKVTAKLADVSGLLGKVGNVRWLAGKFAGDACD